MRAEVGCGWCGYFADLVWLVVFDDLAGLLLRGYCLCDCCLGHFEELGVGLIDGDRSRLRRLFLEMYDILCERREYSRRMRITSQIVGAIEASDRK